MRAVWPPSASNLRAAPRREAQEPPKARAPRAEWPTNRASGISARALTRPAGEPDAEVVAEAAAEAEAEAEELTAPDDMVRAGRAAGVGAPGAKSSSP